MAVRWNRLIVVGLVVAWALGAFEPPWAGAAEAPRVSEAGPTPSVEERAILTLDEAFVKAYNAGDVGTLAALFTEDAVIVEADGSRYRGRDLIAGALAATLQADKGVRIALDVESIRFLTPDSAKEVGRSVVRPTSGPAVVRLYTALYVRRDGRWLIADVREDPDPAVRPHDRLVELSWLIGKWMEEAPGAETRVDCHWSKDGNFLIRAFQGKLQGRPAFSAVQRIGWDPLARQIRSWEFDSEGGYGEGRWTRDGDRWIVKHSGVRPEGTVASSTNIITHDRPDLVRWTTTHRVVAGRSEPDEPVRALVRVPSPPGAKAGANQPSPTPAPSASSRPPQ